MDENTGSGTGATGRSALIWGDQRGGPDTVPRCGSWRAVSRRCALLALVPAALLGGCRAPSNTAPEPTGGGSAYVLDEDLFSATVAPVFTAKGCDTIACHGGGFRGTFALSPLDDKDLDFEFAQASLQVDGDEPSQSPLLLKPLAEAAGGAVHAADPAQHGFTSTDDPGYQAILQWIEAGEFR